MIFKLHKLSRFRTFQDQLELHFVQWLTVNEFCRNQANFTTQFSKSIFVVDPVFVEVHRTIKATLEYSPTSARTGVHITSYIKISLLVRIDCAPPVVFPDLYKSSQLFAVEPNEQFFYYFVYLKAITYSVFPNYIVIFLCRNIQYLGKLDCIVMTSNV